MLAFIYTMFNSKTYQAICYGRGNRRLS